MLRSIRARQVRCIQISAALVVAALECHALAAEPSAAPAATLTGRPGGLTADQAASRAKATSFAIEQKRQELAVAAESFDRAVYDFVPRLTGQASYFRLSRARSGSLGTLVAAPGAAPGSLGAGQELVAVPLSFESLQNATSFGASLTLPLTDYVFRLFQAKDGAKAQVEASDLVLQATRRKTAYEARALYYDWVRAVLEAATAEQNLTLSREHATRLHAMATADAASPADVARADATEAAAERLLVAAQSLAALQQERLRIAMHDRSTVALSIGEDLALSPPAGPAPDASEVTRRALERRPELRALSLTAEAYRKQAAATRSLTLPRLDGLAQATFANPNQRYFPQNDEFKASWQVGVQLSYSPNDSFLNSTQVRAAEARARAATAERAQLLDAIRLEATDAVLAERTARTSFTTSARRLVAAETSYRVRHERFVVGQATLVELTEAQTELFNAKLEVVQAQVAIRLARARISYVSGAEQ